jgi:hypothetical protein
LKEGGREGVEGGREGRKAYLMRPADQIQIMPLQKALHDVLPKGK